MRAKDFAITARTPSCSGASVTRLGALGRLLSLDERVEQVLPRLVLGPELHERLPEAHAGLAREAPTEGEQARTDLGLDRLVGAHPEVGGVPELLLGRRVGEWQIRRLRGERGHEPLRVGQRLRAGDPAGEAFRDERAIDGAELLTAQPAPERLPSRFLIAAPELQPAGRHPVVDRVLELVAQDPERERLVVRVERAVAEDDGNLRLLAVDRVGKRRGPLAVVEVAGASAAAQVPDKVQARLEVAVPGAPSAVDVGDGRALDVFDLVGL